MSNCNSRLILSQFHNGEKPIQLVRILRCEQADQALQTRPVAIEFFNSDALNLLRSAKEN